MSKKSFAEEVWESVPVNNRHNRIGDVERLQKKGDPKMVEKTITIFWPLLRGKWSMQWTFEEFLKEFQEVQSFSRVLITSQHELDAAHEKLVSMRAEWYKASGEAKEKLVWPILHLADDIRKKFVHNFILAVFETCNTTNAQLLAKQANTEDPVELGPEDATQFNTLEFKEKLEQFEF